ncbi:MAG: STAS domain-containing protein [Calditrichaeota bacterium]|nr:STAS domain-containing protein [Calditrichota bacterium]
MEGIQLSVKQAGVDHSISIIKVGGYIDTTTSAELEHSLEQLLQQGKYKIIIDLKTVDYISSAGWGIFISEIKGIREKNGDLKLVGMIPDVYEVFELLEFNFILRAFETIDEAIIDFDKDQGGRPIVVTPEQPIPTRKPSSAKSTSAERQPVALESDIEKISGPVVEDKSVEEKIKQLVMENPDNGSIKIMKELNTPKYENVKLSWFQVVRLLKKLDLNSKKKRVAFFKKSALRKRS